jgi:hypothetical protein
MDVNVIIPAVGDVNAYTPRAGGVIRGEGRDRVLVVCRRRNFSPSQALVMAFDLDAQKWEAV